MRHLKTLVRSHLCNTVILGTIFWFATCWQVLAEVIVRVEIANSRSPVVIGSSTPATLSDGKNQPYGQLKAMQAVLARPVGNGIQINGMTTSVVRVKPSHDGLIAVNGRWYHGEVVLMGTGSLLAVNYVDLEDYVASVVDAEMGASFSAEALKAQAVAARTYVLYHRSKTRWFDVHSDTRSQVYRGLSNRSQAAIAATEATRGVVMVYGNQYVNAMYSASNGGRTVAVQGIPYFQSLPDVTHYPRNGHGIGMSQWGAQEKAKKGWNFLQILAYYYRGVGVGRLPP